MRDIDPIDYLSSIDGVEQPDPGFAADLLDDLLLELTDAPAPGASPLHLVENEGELDPEDEDIHLAPPVSITPATRPRSRIRILEVAALLAFIIGGVAWFDRTPDDGMNITTEVTGDLAPPSLVDLLADDGRFAFMAALLEQGTPGTDFADCSLGGDYTIYAQTDASVDAFLVANGLDATSLLADPDVVSALLDDLAVEGAIPPPRSFGGDEPAAAVVAGDLIGTACNGVAYEVGGFWVPSDAAVVALFDVGSDLAAAEAIAEGFMVARSVWDGPTMRSLVADDALIRGEVGGASADSYFARARFEQVTNARIVDHDCTASTPQLVRCTYTLESDLGLAQRTGPYADNLVILTIQGGEIQQVVNSIGNNADFLEDGEAFRSWLQTTHPDDLQVMLLGNAPLLSDGASLSDEAIALWALRLPEYLEASDQ